METISSVLQKNDLLVAFVVVGGLMLLSGWLSKNLTRGRLHGSAIAIIAGLALAYWGGVSTGGTKGLADFAVLSGLALMGGSMLRDFAIVSTAFGVDLKEIKRSGLTGVLSIVLGVVVSFIVGAAVAYAFGYRDAESLATIGAGAATYIVGPVTGTAVGASSEVIALSVAAGLVRSEERRVGKECVL